MEKLPTTLLFFLGAQLFGNGSAWGGYDKVKLRDIKVLTLVVGGMTTGRRSSPVPQLKCVGGTAYGAFTPQVVQCYNKGSDGFNVQWECKTDMDNAYRFGRISVNCEGYDYPDDPYVLKGSCGLEYTIDLTNEGLQRETKDMEGHSVWITIIAWVVVSVIFFAVVIYINHQPAERTQQRSNTNGNGGSGIGGGSRGPRPTPTLISSYSYTYYSGPSFSYTRTWSSGCSSRNVGAIPAGTGTDGFWEGAAAGGAVGYMVGSQNYYPSNAYGYGGGGYLSSGWGSGTTSGSSGSTGTRTASGFGGTRRR